MPNKTTTVVKEGILRAYDTIGGDAQFALWAGANPGEFYTKILVKVLPLQLTGEGDSPLIPGAITFLISQQAGAENRS